MKPNVRHRIDGPTKAAILCLGLVLAWYTRALIGEVWVLAWAIARHPAAIHAVWHAYELPLILIAVYTAVLLGLVKLAFASSAKRVIWASDEMQAWQPQRRIGFPPGV